jgi:surfactin synthase thioesterase subunit
MPKEVDLLPLALPGHDGRLNLPLSTDLLQLANELRQELSVHALDRPFAMLGHSMGALLAFEIVRGLRRHNQPMPRLLVLTSCRPPHMIVAKEPLHKLPDAELVSVLQERYGGIPAVVRDNPELQKLLLPALRADMQMIETYSYAEEPPLDVPLLVMGGTDDPAISASHLQEWQRHTTHTCDVRLVPGGHFFLFSSGSADAAMPAGRIEEPPPALRLVLARLEQCIAAGFVDPSAKQL